MFDKKGIKYLLIIIPISFLIYVFTGQAFFSTHPVFNYYIQQLHGVILFLPVVIFLYNILPLRKILDYSKYLRNVKEIHFLIGIFLISIIATNLISYYLYDHIPQGDDVTAFYQAKIIASGERWIPPPKYPQFFIKEMVQNNNKWSWMKPIGHALLLSIGVLLKISWIICPLLASLSLLIFYFLLKNVFNSITARVGTVFLLLSPTFLFVSSSMLPQNSGFFFSLLSTFFIAKTIKTKKAIYSLFSGLSIGFAFFSRPQLPTVFLIILFVFLCISVIRNKELTIYPAFLFVLGFMPFLFLQLIDNYLLTGNPFRYGYWLYSLKANAMGFGAGRGSSSFGIYGHNFTKAIINLIYNGFAWSLHLFGWPLLSLVFIPIPFIKKTKNQWELLAMGLIMGTTIFWMFYWFHGISPMGPKYYYEITPFLVILTVRGIDRLKINIRPLITLFFLINIFVYIPQTTKVFGKWGTNLNCYNLVKKEEIHNTIVFVRNLQSSPKMKYFLINLFNYSSVSFRNALNLEEGDIIYAKDLGEEENKLLIKLYPDRKVYLFEYLDETHYHLKPLNY